MTPQRGRGAPDQGGAPSNPMTNQFDAGKRSAPVADEVLRELIVRQAANLAVADRRRAAIEDGDGPYQGVDADLLDMAPDIAAEILRPGHRALLRELAVDEQAGAA
jgi:hypothetical protein